MENVLIFCPGIHGYAVNERLFTEPVNMDADGNSVCPACTRSRKQPTPESPGFVRYLKVVCFCAILCLQICADNVVRRRQTTVALYYRCISPIGPDNKPPPQQLIVASRLIA